MAQAINYASIAPASSTAAMGAKAVSSNFLTGGHKLKGGSSSKEHTCCRCFLKRPRTNNTQNEWSAAAEASSWKTVLWV